MPSVIAKDSDKPVYHFEAHDGDWGEDDLNNWENASKGLKDDSDVEDWNKLNVEKHHGKLGGGDDNGHFFAHQNEDSETEQVSDTDEEILELTGMDAFALDLLELYADIEELDEVIHDMDLELLDEQQSNGWLSYFY